jgi:hypothetical protein
MRLAKVFKMPWGINMKQRIEDSAKFTCRSLVGVTALALMTTSAFAQVPGWPTDKIAQGTVMIGGSEVPLLQRRPVDTFYTYAGLTGNGDPGIIITRDKKIDEIMRIMRVIEKNTGKQKMLTVVFYNVNASDGPAGMQRELRNDAPNKILQKHIINYISILKQLEGFKDAARPVPATLILSPDFLGELHKDCQPRRCKLKLNTAVPLGEALTEAYDYLNLDKSKIPPEFLAPGTEIKDYLRAINWMTRTFAPSVPFGWQINVWAGDPTGHGWLHTAAQGDPSLIAKRVKEQADFLRTMNVMGNADRKIDPDFIAFDKYERDVFDKGLAGAGVNAGYLYSSQVLDVYVQLAKGVSEAFNNLPIMLWQVPGGHLQTTSDVDERKANASTEPDYILGNPALADDLSNLSPYIRDTPMPTNNPIYRSAAQTVGEYLKCPSTKPKCWQTGHMTDLKAANVFSVLWGGGSTTSVVGLASNLDDNGWVFSRLKALGLDNEGRSQTRSAEPEKESTSSKKSSRKKR